VSVSLNTSTADKSAIVGSEKPTVVGGEGTDSTSPRPQDTMVGPDKEGGLTFGHGGTPGGIHGRMGASAAAGRGGREPAEESVRGVRDLQQAAQVVDDEIGGHTTSGGGVRDGWTCRFTSGGRGGSGGEDTASHVWAVTILASVVIDAGGCPRRYTGGGPNMRERTRSQHQRAKTTRPIMRYTHRYTSMCVREKQSLPEG